MSTDRSTHPNVVEYAVQTMIKRGKSPSAAAKDTVKKHHGTENMFFGPGPSTIDAATLEDALWDRLVDFTITGISRIKEGKEHYALDGTLQHFNQKPNIRAELKRRVVEKMGRDPFTNDDVLKETPMARRTARENTPDAEAAGAQYAQDQITSDYFMDWVREQLLEASRMDPSTVLPLETKSDARVIAHNMLQQLEWDTKRDLRDNEMARLIGVDIVEREMHKAFFQGFDVATVAALGGLANELLEINRGMRGGSVSEARRGGPSTKPWFGRGEGRLEYAIKIDGIENDFPTKPFGRQEEWPHVQWFMQNAKNEWIRAKHASSGTAALKRWIKDVKPSQFYARWDEGDDSIQVWYTPSEGGVSEAPQGRTPRQIQDFKNGFAEGYREGKHGETDVPGRSPSFEYAEGARLGLLAGARRSGEKFEKALSDAVATWTGGGGGVSEALHEGGKQATKPGKHGTLRLWRIAYTDSNDPGFGEHSYQRWAYDKQDAWYNFNEEVNSAGESWEIVKIESVLDTGPKRLSREARSEGVSEARRGRPQPLVDTKLYSVTWAGGRQGNLTDREAVDLVRQLRNDWVESGRNGILNVRVWYRDGSLVPYADLERQFYPTGSPIPGRAGFTGEARRQGHRTREGTKTATTWTQGKLYGSDKITLFGQRPSKPNLWIEIMGGDSVRFIITKMRDAGEQGERVVKTVTTNVVQTDPEWDQLARSLGMPGAGYAIEIGERLLGSR